MPRLRLFLIAGTSTPSDTPALNPSVCIDLAYSESCVNPSAQTMRYRLLRLFPPTFQDLVPVYWHNFLPLSNCRPVL